MTYNRIPRGRSKLAAIFLLGCWMGGAWPGLAQTNPAANAVPATNPPAALAPVADEEFYAWLLGLGADSNKVAALRQAAETRRYWDWFKDRPLAVRQPEQLLNGKDLAAFIPGWSVTALSLIAMECLF
ncbi:MAG: hypothetical protein N3J91_00880 [Verrucomicrobiae bacterium]|nr:hypothetical protein [Verrucomicrobiae bacterium]